MKCVQRNGKILVEPLFVYVAYCAGTKLTKIGVTENLDYRMRNLSNGCGLRVALKAATKGGRFLERALLGSYPHARKLGEWFALSREERETLINAVTWREFDTVIRNESPHDRLMRLGEAEDYRTTASCPVSMGTPSAARES